MIPSLGTVLGCGKSAHIVELNASLDNVRLVLILRRRGGICS